MASVKILARNIESGAEVVMDISDDMPVDKRMLKAAGWLPIMVLKKPVIDEGNGGPAGYPAHASYLRP